MARLCVFCGSGHGREPTYGVAARELGQRMAERGIGLVYGGAHRGLMGVVADAVLQGGGEVIGVIPQLLVDREIAHAGLTQQIVVQSMHERKAQMAAHADAFAALPGGFGTLDELMEIITWRQLGLHDKPIGLLDVNGYFAGLHTFIMHMVDAGFVAASDAARIEVAPDPNGLLDLLFE
jgi:uncharacterized protein (TIGR00730 family)